MPLVTLRVLEGADRGKVFEGLQPPVTIGREEGNTIQLNDERVSRFHVKIQEDHDRLVVADLESTNGTKVNGESIQLRILRVGDTLSVGRSVLLFGSRDEIAERLARLRDDYAEDGGTLEPEAFERLARQSALDFELNWGDDSNMEATLHALKPPELPDRLSPGQAAQLSELLEYIHLRLRNLISSARPDTKENANSMVLSLRRWQNLVDMQARIAEYLREVGNPR